MICDKVYKLVDNTNMKLFFIIKKLMHKADRLIFYSFYNN